MPSAGRKTRRWILGSVFLLAILLAVVVLTWPLERLLLEMAHPVVAVDTTKSTVRTPRQAVYWLTSARLLIITTEHEASRQNDWSGYADLFDATTRQRTRLLGLTHLLNARGLAHWGVPRDFQVSPDGTRLIWLAMREDGVGTGWRLDLRWAGATIEGTQLQEWPEELTDLASFWADDDHYINVVVDRLPRLADTVPRLRVHSFSTAHGDGHIKPLSADTSTVLAPYDKRHPLETTLHFIDEGHLKITRTWFDARSGKIANRTDEVPLPGASSLDWWPRNSHSDALIFFLRRTETPSILSLLHRFIPFVSAKPTVTEGLWVSQMGGKQIHEIGHLPVHTHSEDIEEAQVEQVQWLPDGKQISFVYQGILYVMPIKTSE